MKGPGVVASVALALLHSHSRGERVAPRFESHQLAQESVLLQSRAEELGKWKLPWRRDGDEGGGEEPAEKRWKMPWHQHGSKQEGEQQQNKTGRWRRPWEAAGSKQGSRRWQSGQKGHAEGVERTGKAAKKSGDQKPRLSLCDPLIVEETCQKISGDLDGPAPTSVSWAAIEDMFSTTSLEVAQIALGLPLDEEDVDCMDLCTAAVQYAHRSGHILPPFSNVACRTAHGSTVCDVEADPVELEKEFGSIRDEALPDKGALIASEKQQSAQEEEPSEEAAGKAEADDEDGEAAEAHLYQVSSHHTTRSSLASLLQRSAGVDDAAPSGSGLAHRTVDWVSKVAALANWTGALQYTAWEAVERIANLFCVHPASQPEAEVVNTTEPSLLQDGVTSGDLGAINQRLARGRAWMSTVLRELHNRNVAAAQQKWFGGSGGMNTEQVRQRILRTMNFVNREFSQGFHFIYPANNAKQSACASGAIAYVWRASYSKPTGYQETTGPKCRSSDNPRTKNCGLDENGKYYVYLCSNYLQSSENYQIGVLVHEAAHHAGPNDVTGDLSRMKRETQQNQVMNAANYENFAKSVVSGGCEDTDNNCAYYTSYCNQANIKASCKRTCGLCGSSPPRRRSSPPRRRRSAGGGGGGGQCRDLDGNCRYYTSYCNTDNVKTQCRRTCGLCSGGGSPRRRRSPPRRRAGGGQCRDLDVNCAYYTSYCNTDNIKTQCRKTCGLCRGGGSSPRRRAPSSGGCVDTYGSCQWYRDNGKCNIGNVRTQCRRTCGLCR